MLLRVILRFSLFSIVKCIINLENNLEKQFQLLYILLMLYIEMAVFIEINKGTI